MSLSAVPYTAFWCEENVVNLLAATDSHESWAVFISNPARTVQLAQQRVAEQRSDPDVSFTVLWDYHVVAVVREPDHSLSVVDRDSRLGPKVPLDEYLTSTFPVGIPHPFISHMLVAEGGDGSYAVAPPAYPPIVGDAAKLSGESHNLWSRFLVMHNKIDDTSGYGYVLADVGKLQAYLQSPDKSTKC